MSEKYDVQQVCENGHQITDCYNIHLEERRKFCQACGAATLTACPGCGAEIQGAQIKVSESWNDARFGRQKMIRERNADVPSHCHNCGKAYPWTQSKIATAKGEKVIIQNDPVDSLSLLFDRFHLVARQLQSRHQNRGTISIDDEYDVQDLLHALLRIFFDDVRPEEWTPSYAGKSSRMDFLLKKEKLVVEVKKTRKDLTDKEIGDQLIIDIKRYAEHPDCKNLLCFVYDPEGRIGNPTGLEDDLSRSENGLTVLVFVRPKSS